MFVIKNPRRLAAVANTPAPCAPPKLNNRSGLASDESIQRQAVRIGRVDTIVNDVKFFYTNTNMVNLIEGIEQEKAFRSHAQGYWSHNGGVAPELWNDWKWQLKNRVTKLEQLEEHLSLSEEERAGVLLSGDKLALAITPHFFNLIPRENPD